MRYARFTLLTALSITAVFASAQNPRMNQFLTAKPGLGDTAPGFTLKNLEGKEVALASFKGKVPVVIEFGSYT